MVQEKNIEIFMDFDTDILNVRHLKRMILRYLKDTININGYK